MTINPIEVPRCAYLPSEFGNIDNPQAVFEKGRLNAYDIGGVRMLVEEFDNKGMIAGEKKAYMALPVDGYWRSFVIEADYFIEYHYTTDLGCRDIKFGGLAKLEEGKTLVSIFQENYGKPNALGNFIVVGFKGKHEIVQFVKNSIPDFPIDVKNMNKEEALEVALAVAVSQKFDYSPTMGLMVQEMKKWSEEYFAKRDAPRTPPKVPLQPQVKRNQESSCFPFFDKLFHSSKLPRSTTY